MSKPKYNLTDGILISEGVIETISQIVMTSEGFYYRTKNGERHENEIKEVYRKVQRRVRKKKAKISEVLGGKP